MVSSKQIQDLKERLREAGQYSDAEIVSHLQTWKGAVIDQLIVSGVLNDTHESDPFMAVRNMIEAEVQAALDPRVSTAARDLLVRGQNEGLAAKGTRVAQVAVLEWLKAESRGLEGVDPEWFETIKDGLLKYDPIISSQDNG